MFWRFGSDAREAPGRGDGLVEQRVEPAVGPEQRRQRLDVGRAELGVDPPVEDGSTTGWTPRSSSSTAASVEYPVFVLRPLGRPSSTNRISPSCLGLPIVNWCPTDGVDLGLEARDLRGELACRAPPARRRSRAMPGGLHPGEDRDQRQLDLGEQPVDALVAERLLQRGADGERRQRLEPGDGRRAAGRRRTAAGRGRGAPRRRRRSSGPAAPR